MPASTRARQNKTPARGTAKSATPARPVQPAVPTSVSTTKRKRPSGENQPTTSAPATDSDAVEDSEAEEANDPPRKRLHLPGAFPEPDGALDEDPIAGPSNAVIVPHAAAGVLVPPLPLNPFEVLLGNNLGGARVQKQVEALRARLTEDGDDGGVVLDIDRGGQDQKQRMAEFLQEQNRGFEKNIGVQDALANLGLENLETLLPGLDTQLLGHQAIGVSWMLEKERNPRERGGILADDMGLGKTVQAIALMAKNPPQIEDDEEEEWERPKNAALVAKQTLVVAPAALLDQWRDEIETKSDMFTTHIYHGAGKAKNLTHLRKYDVVITSYHTMLYDQNPRKNRDQKGLLHSNPWYRIILDEAQIIRNRSSQTSVAAAKLDGIYRWSLTGTPFTNGLHDLYALLRFSRLRPWNDWDDFRAHIVSKQEGESERAASLAHTITEKHLLRRTKESTIDGKPILTLKPKTIDFEYVDLSPEERKIYEAVEKRQKQRINNFLKRGTLLKNWTAVFVMILRLRQVCSHPQLIVYAARDMMDENVEAVVDDGDGDEDPDEGGANDLATANRIMGIERVKKLKDIFRAQAKARAAQKLLPASGQNEDDGLDDECPICFEVYTDCRLTKCGHAFCKTCIDGVFQGQVEYQHDEAAGIPIRPCPKCRTEIRIDQLFKAALFEPSMQERARIKIEVGQAKKKADKQKTIQSAAAFSFDLTLDGSDEDELPSLSDLWGGGKGKAVKGKPVKSEIKAGKKVEAEPKVKAETKVKGETKVKTGTKAKVEPKWEMKVKAETKPGMKGKGESEGEGKGKGKGKGSKEKAAKTITSDDDDIVDLTRDQFDANISPTKPPKKINKGKGVAKRGKFIVDSSEEDSMDDDKEDSSDEENTFDPAMLDDFQDFQPSAKMVKMVELLQQWREEAPEDKVIIYSQWTSCLNLLQNLLAVEGMQCIRYDGKMNRQERSDAVKRFKKTGGPRIMLISLKCGGVGLNLVEANRVISFDLAWNLATEMQAFDRVHRLGQSKEVTVKRLIVRNSIEERILGIQNRKQHLADMALGEGDPNKRPPRLGVGDILALFGM